MPIENKNIFQKVPLFLKKCTTKNYLNHQNFHQIYACLHRNRNNRKKVSSSFLLVELVQCFRMQKYLAECNIPQIVGIVIWSHLRLGAKKKFALATRWQLKYFFRTLIHFIPFEGKLFIRIVKFLLGTRGNFLRKKMY